MYKYEWLQIVIIQKWNFHFCPEPYFINTYKGLTYGWFLLPQVRFSIYHLLFFKYLIGGR